MHKPSLVYAAIFGGLAVALGAFGAHGLEGLTTDEKILHSFQTGVQYEMYHALALLGTGLLAAHLRNNWLIWASRCFVTGIILFSGSLYLITFLKIQGSTAIRFAGPVTPLGGMFFIFGWLCLLVAVLRK
jgi:uncharacterized membrane protein YgdD (TMEM256/DUF423 family)